MKILPIGERLPPPPVKFVTEEVRHYPYSCGKFNFLINSETQLVECQTCGQPLDPFAVLLEIAHDWKQIELRWEIASRDLERKREELQQVKRDLTNAKARLKRAASRPAP
jgi:hypothetical protein